MGAEGSFPVIHETPNFLALEGSNEFYNRSASQFFLPEIEAQFLSCYCKQSPCPNRHITCAHDKDRSPDFFTVHRIPHVSGKAGDSDSE